MSIKRLSPGPRMSKAVAHGSTVYVSGQVADKTKGRSVTEQTGEILAIIDDLLAQSGSDKSELMSATIWLTDMSTFAEMNAVWEGWVVPGETPARATVELVSKQPALGAALGDLQIKPATVSVHAALR